MRDSHRSIVPATVVYVYTSNAIKRLFHEFVSTVLTNNNTVVYRVLPTGSPIPKDRVLAGVLKPRRLHSIRIKTESTFKRLVIWRSVFLFFGTKSLVVGLG